MTKRAFSFAANPFIQVVLPFIGGIVLFGVCDRILVPCILATTAAVCIVIKAIVPKTQRLSIRHVVVNAFHLLLLATAGWVCAYINEPTELPSSKLNKETTFSCTVDEIRQRDFSTEMLVHADIGSQQVGLRLIAIHNDYTTHIGDEISCRGVIEKIENSSTPDAFDYASFMKHKGILYECAIEKNGYSTIRHNNGIHKWADRLKQRTITLIRLSGIDNRAASLAIAFCTGDRRYMPESDRQAFSQAGLAHILAVSGLHIGVIATILSVLLFYVRGPKLNKLRFAIILICIWLYVAFTGMPNSAIRAAVMVSFVFASKIFLRKHSSINALAASAFFIALFSPNAVYDAGFQLSFLSVAGILLWADNLHHRFSNPILDYISASIAVTIAAQLATAPLIIFYFNSFPTSFFISNFIIIPILPILMLLIIIAVFISALGYKFTVIFTAINWIYALLVGTSQFCVAHLPALSNLWIDAGTATFLSALTITVGIAIKYIPTKFLTVINISLLCCAIASFTANRINIPKSGHFIDAEPTSTNIVAFDNDNLYIMNSLNDTTLVKEFVDNAHKFIAKHRFKSIKYITSETRANRVHFNYPFAYIDGKSYVFVAGNYRRNHKTGNPIKVDYAILTKRYYNQLADIPNFFTADTIVLPREIYKDRRDTLVSFAKRYKLPFRLN